jgi:glutaconate CoA-transferase, subunit A
MNARGLSLAEAVEAYVADGDCVWLGNFGAQLFAAGRELVRQGRRDLHVVIASGGLLLDELLAAGVIAEVTFSHCWSPVGPRPTPTFRRAWQDGSDVRWHELSFGMIIAALGAAAAGVPFAPVAVSPDVGYHEWSRDWLAAVETPFGSATVVRALAPDVAFVHADHAGEHGDAVLVTPLGESLLAVQAARRTVVVAEELVPGVPAGAQIPGLLVDAVVARAGAVAPDGAPGRYERDVAAYLAHGGVA